MILFIQIEFSFNCSLIVFQKQNSNFHSSEVLIRDQIKKVRKSRIGGITFGQPIYPKFIQTTIAYAKICHLGQFIPWEKLNRSFSGFYNFSNFIVKNVWFDWIRFCLIHSVFHGLNEFSRFGWSHDLIICMKLWRFLWYLIVQVLSRWIIFLLSTSG